MRVDTQPIKLTYKASYKKSLLILLLSRASVISWLCQQRYRVLEAHWHLSTPLVMVQTPLPSLRFWDKICNRKLLSFWWHLQTGAMSCRKGSSQIKVSSGNKANIINQHPQASKNKLRAVAPNYKPLLLQKDMVSGLWGTQPSWLWSVANRQKFDEGQ